jgi:hypothetical protein
MDRRAQSAPVRSRATGRRGARWDEEGENGEEVESGGGEVGVGSGEVGGGGVERRLSGGKEEGVGACARFCRVCFSLLVVLLAVGALLPVFHVATEGLDPGDRLIQTLLTSKTLQNVSESFVPIPERAGEALYRMGLRRRHPVVIV